MNCYDDVIDVHDKIDEALAAAKQSPAVVQKVYKIRNKKTGAFSRGGCWAPPWAPVGSKGKTWSGIGPLKGHLRQFLRDDCSPRGGMFGPAAEYINNAEVVEYTLVTTTTGLRSLSSVHLDMLEDDRKRQARQLASYSGDDA